MGAYSADEISHCKDFKKMILKKIFYYRTKTNDYLYKVIIGQFSDNRIFIVF